MANKKPNHRFRVPRLMLLPCLKITRKILPASLFIAVGLASVVWSVLAVGDLGIQQNSRLDELDATLEMAELNGLLLSKAAGTGSWDAQCCELNGVMPASQIDDVGNYLVVSLAGILSLNEFTSANLVLFWFNLVVFAISIALLANFVSKYRSQTFSKVFCVLGVVSLTYSTVTDSLLFSAYGRKGLPTQLGDSYDRVDLFYGLQSTILFFALVLSLLLFRKDDYEITKANWYARLLAMCLVLAIAEIFRSGASLTLVPVLIWILRGKQKMIPTILVAGVSAIAISRLLLTLVSSIRWLQTGMNPFESSGSHPVWHTLYLGLSFNFDGSNNSFGIQWSDNWLYELAQRIEPSIAILDNSYGTLVRRLFLEQVRNEPVAVLVQYISKLISGIILIIPELAFIVVLQFTLHRRSRLVSNGTQYLSRVYPVVLYSLWGCVVAIPSVTYLNLTIPVAHICVLNLLLLLLNPINRRSVLHGAT